jgi:tripartite-type tricarboxylate transporter receptor subunit TctC
MKFTIIKRAVAALALLAALPAAAQNYPNKSILMVVPLPTASATDIVMRLVTQKMAESMGQQIAIENIPGAAGMLGGEKVARAAADGYVIGGFSDSVVNGVPLLYPNVPYDPFTSFAPVGLTAWVTFVMMTHPSLPVKTAGDFVALAKSQKDPMDYASGGNGSTMHLAMEVFKSATGVKLNHIPYRGSITGVLDVTAGRVPVMITSLAPVLETIRAGKLRALGITSLQRSPLLPDVPTVTESGVKGFTYATWQAIYAPRNTPRAIVDRLNAEMVKAVNDPVVKDRLIKSALEPATSTPEQLAAQTRSGYDNIAKIIKSAGIKVD